jgi:hypothetical protein
LEPFFCHPTIFPHLPLRFGGKGARAALEYRITFFAAKHAQTPLEGRFEQND